jgi:hypothetical protein
MNYMKRAIAVLSSAAVSLPALAAPFDGSAPLLCGIRTVMECDEIYECYQTTPEDVNLPDFFQVNLADKEIIAAGIRRAGSRTPIERVEHLGGKLLLQGGDVSAENQRGGVGWSMIIDETDGKLSMSGVSQQFALVIYGACMVR